MAPAVVSGVLVVAVAALILFVTFLRPASHAGATPAPVSEAWRTVALLLAILAGATLVLGLLSSLLHVLRRKRNPLYWQLACWVLVVFGIATRQLVATSAALPSPGQLLVSIAVGVAVLPGLMRWLNRVSAKPGLQHVAVPYSLGFFLDLAQVLASSYVVRLPWIRG